MQTAFKTVTKSIIFIFHLWESKMYLYVQNVLELLHNTEQGTVQRDEAGAGLNMSGWSTCQGYKGTILLYLCVFRFLLIKILEYVQTW